MDVRTIPNVILFPWDMPSEKKMSNCGSYMVIKTRKNWEEYAVCSNKKCGYKEEE